METAVPERIYGTVRQPVVRKIAGPAHGRGTGTGKGAKQGLGKYFSLGCLRQPTGDLAKEEAGERDCDPRKGSARERESGTGSGVQSRTPRAPRFRIVHGTNLGTADRRATDKRPLDDNDTRGERAHPDVFLGSDGVRERRRAGGRGPEASGCCAGAGHGRSRVGQGNGGSNVLGP